MRRGRTDLRALRGGQDLDWLPSPDCERSSSCCQALRWSARPVRSAKSCGRCSIEHNFPLRSHQIPRLRAQRRQNHRLQGQKIPDRADPARSVRRRAISSSPARPRRSAGNTARWPPRPAPSSSTTPAPGAWTPMCRWSCPRSTPTRCERFPRASSPTRTARRSRWWSPSSRCTTWPASSASSCPPTRRRPARGPRGCSSWTPRSPRIGRGEQVPPVTAHAAQLAGNVLPHDWKARRGRLQRRRDQDGQGDQEDHGRRHDPGLADDGARAGAHRPFRGDQPRIRPADHASSRPAKRLRKAPGIILARRLRQGRSAAAAALRGPRRGLRRPHSPRSDHCQRPESLGRRRQPRKGAATNAVQIAEVLVQHGGCRKKLRPPLAASHWLLQQDFSGHFFSHLARAVIKLTIVSQQRQAMTLMLTYRQRSKEHYKFHPNWQRA